MPSRNTYRSVALLAAAALVVPLALSHAGAQAAPVASGPATGTQKVVDLPSTAALAGGLEIENAFVSSVGWVKPGDTYPSRILLRNTGTDALSNVRVGVDNTTGMTISDARAVGAGAAGVAGGQAFWNIPSLAGGAVASLVLEHRAASLAQVPTVVWRNLSSIATVSIGDDSEQVQSHGPKVIPSSGGYETARYGDRPFPVVPVDYLNFKHTASAEDLDTAINDPANPGSTFNLYQEMSFGQLFPKGDVASAGIASRAYDAEADNLAFTTQDPTTTNTCQTPATTNPTNGAPPPTYTERIVDGWYQLPSTREYYGSDANGSAVVGSAAGVGALQAIDSGCGPTAKAAYDAAVVADPDIDYSDFDTDKDGVVDFFEVIFQGCGGNGGSQTAPVACPNPADVGDNIWPHSSSLEFSYTDANGQTGYVSQDQLKDLEGFPLWYTDDSRAVMTRDDTGPDLVVYVRVGPYNVNPETSIDKASVISHEYGHSLGLPDYYSTGSRETYGDFQLMATDKSQNMDIIAKKELGWIVPDVLVAGQTEVTGWQDSKIDTGVINWVTADGAPYRLDAAAGDRGIHNGQAYVASLPGRQLLDPAVVAQGASGRNVWFSGSGNDYGCAPTGGRNFDVVIPGLEDVPAGTKITAEFASFFDIEWDYDFGYVMSGTPDAQGNYSYVAHPSDMGYTSTVNPNANACQTQYVNGLSGSSGAFSQPGYNAGLRQVDSTLGEYYDGQSTFIPDAYDISDLAGVAGGVLRFSYATDPGLARPGWFIDDLVIKAGDKVLFSSDFEGTTDPGSAGSPIDPRLYPGGCKEDLSSSGGRCTEGWAYVAAGDPSSMEHAYLMEMRDRSGFDFDGRNENDREAIAFEPGLLLTYTDEAHGYGNVGTDNPPAQTPLDSVPTPDSDTPDLHDATFQAGGARASFSDASADPHLDNYSEPARGAAKDGGATVQSWTFGYDCLDFTIGRMVGNEVPTVELPGSDAKDLVGDVSFTLGTGCAPFNYGFAVSSGSSPQPTEAPVAAAVPAVLSGRSLAATD